MNINNPCFNVFYEHRNTSVNWLNADSQKTYFHNWRNFHDQLEKNGWIKKSISYTFNSEGFRSEEFTQDDSILFLGCSITMGIGLPLEDIFPTKVSTALNLKCLNLGLAGTSSDTAFRLALHYLEKLRPKVVVLSTLFPARMEILNFDKVINLAPRWGYHSDLYKEWLATEENVYLHEIKNMLAIKYLCETIGSKFIYIDDIDTISNENNTLARDLLHPGINFHKSLSDIILEKINGALT